MLISEIEFGKWEWTLDWCSGSSSSRSWIILSLYIALSDEVVASGKFTFSKIKPYNKEQVNFYLFDYSDISGKNT